MPKTIADVIGPSALFAAWNLSVLALEVAPISRPAVLAASTPRAAMCGSGDPHDSRSGDRRYKVPPGVRDGYCARFPAGPVHPFASGPVSPSATAASKVMERRLTRNPARANLAILELVLNLNPRPCRTSQKMDPVVPCALRLLSKSTVCQQAPRGRLRSSGVLPIHLKYNSLSRRTLNP